MRVKNTRVSVTRESTIAQKIYKLEFVDVAIGPLLHLTNAEAIIISL